MQSVPPLVHAWFPEGCTEVWLDSKTESDWYFPISFQISKFLFIVLSPMQRMDTFLSTSWFPPSVSFYSSSPV